MNYKKFFSSTALVTLLSLSHSAFSDSVGLIEDEETSYYVRLQYNGEFGNNIGELKGKYGNSAVVNAKGYDKSGKVIQDYKPEYKTSYIAGSAAVGYTMEGIRVELEGLYSHLDVDTQGYQEDGSAKEGNARRLWLNSLEVAAKTPSSNKDQAGTNKAGTNQNSANTTNDVSIYHDMTNDGFRNIAAMVNGYYDIDLGSDVPVVPYVGAGVGITQIKFLGATEYKPAYQAKAGVSYAVTPDVKLYAGARYFGVYGDEFSKVQTTQERKAATAIADATDASQRRAAANAIANAVSGTATITNSFTGVYGIEAGVMFNF